MKISPNIQTPAKTGPQGNVNRAASKDAPESGGVTARDVVAIGAGAGAAVAGGIYGLGEGLVKGAIENYPKHVKGGAEIGNKVLTPVGGALGAIGTGAIAALAAIGSPVALIGSVVIGAVASTAVSAFKQSGAAIKETAGKAAQTGSEWGGALGNVGATVGKYVGGALGGVAGIFVAVGRGLPAGLETGKANGKQGLSDLAKFPQDVKDTWNVLYPGGREVAGNIGGLAGGTVGAFTATGATVGDGLINSTRRATQWGKATADYVRGEKPEPPQTPKEPKQPEA